MSYSSLVCYLLLCLSILLHATSARHLGVVDKETKGLFHHFGKAVEKEEVHETLSLSSEKLTEENDEIGVHIESWGGGNIIKETDEKTPCMEKEDNNAEGLAGNKLMASSQELVQVVNQIEGWKRQLTRRMLGLAATNTEETIDSKENDSPEDIVVMDYPQPHRKPPIHNMEP